LPTRVRRRPPQLAARSADGAPSINSILILLEH
jgi:hypothetical protein